MEKETRYSNQSIRKGSFNSIIKFNWINFWQFKEFANNWKYWISRFCNWNFCRFNRVGKKFLKGKDAKSEEKSGNKLKITNESGQVIYVENFVQNISNNNTIVNDALSQSFETLENDNSITGYEITDRNNNTLVRVDRNEFEYISVKSEGYLKEKRTLQ